MLNATSSAADQVSGDDTPHLPCGAGFLCDFAPRIA
jgi:hypothetical protein